MRKTTFYFLLITLFFSLSVFSQSITFDWTGGTATSNGNFNDYTEVI